MIEVPLTFSHSSLSPFSPRQPALAFVSGFRFRSINLSHSSSTLSLSSLSPASAIKHSGKDGRGVPQQAIGKS